MWTFAGQRIDAGKTVVLAHGTFDLIHPGHIEHLQFAKSHGDLLIVALSSDYMARLRKGENRPVLPFADRKMVLRAINCVDGVIEAEHPTDDLFENLFHIIKKGRPQVFVTSYPEIAKSYGDILQRIGTKVVTAPRFGVLSTTAIIEKIVGANARPVA
jgi:D-beta-D-heptose 7-phosphate kinase/D-beta-D-heptose 1-phosphate adenosyltransferase